jgi:hypothetical protein
MYSAMLLFTFNHFSEEIPITRIAIIFAVFTSVVCLLIDKRKTKESNFFRFIFGGILAFITIYYFLL